MTLRPWRDSRTIALVGLMGVGKSSVGRRLAKTLALPFRDADQEIAQAAGRPVAEIFDQFGEAEFRIGERKVIARLLGEPAHVLATGGGAFIDADTRRLLKAQAITVWLRADLDTLVERVRRRDTRPLLRGRDPREVLAQLMQVRHPFYAEADVVVDTGHDTHAAAVAGVMEALAAFAGAPA